MHPWGVKGLLTAVLTLTALPQVSAQTAVTNGEERAEALVLVDAWLDAQRAYNRVPGLSAGVVVADKLVWSAGFGHSDVAGKVPATPQTIYSICSISKLFTSVALMEQYDRGKIALDDPLTRYLPWAVPVQDSPSSAPITLRSLLTHASGLPREADFRYWAAPDFTFPTEQQIRSRLPVQHTLYGTYQHYQYSNLGLTLLGEVVEAVARRPYPDVVVHDVLAPLGMEDTRPFMPMSLYGTRLAVGHGAIRRDGTRDALKSFKTNGLTPAAGLTSTVVDLARFASWQFRLLETGRTELLKASTLQEMQRVQFVDPDWQNARGLGFGVYRHGDRTFVGHSGECPGYFTSLMLDRPTKTAVIIMMNAAEPTGPYVNGVFDILKKRSGYHFAGKAPAKVDLSEYAGRYSEQPWGSEEAVVPWAGGLAVLSLPTQTPTRGLAFLKPVGGDRFRRMRDDGSEAEEVVFERDGSGKVASIVQHNNPSPKIS